ncbi:MAG: KamA family radical SAM protein [Spirochaetaceae bacterium]|nr:KamA family radical SAM protein [Spirochaetaceae bacterium]
MTEKNWQSMLNKALTSPDDLQGFSLSEKEKAYFSMKKDHDNLTFMVNPYYASLAEDKWDDPVRRQFIPTVDEYTTKKYELSDPLGEDRYTPVPRLIHRYRDRVLLLVTDSCAMYCRHCFRRSFTGHKAGVISYGELENVAAYLSDHREVNEILLSGGDPLTCSDKKVREILTVIRSVRPDIVIRLATRIPVVLPMRISDSLVNILSENSPIWLVTQFNHSNEITEQAEAAVDKLIGKGIPLLNQSVLLKGINDSVSALENLFQALVRLRIKPYYLFQGDLAAGTSHFRVSIERGREIMSRLRLRISGLALPVYAVDMPGGGGKIPLTENFAMSEDEENYYFRNIEGKPYSYPREK